MSNLIYFCKINVWLLHTKRLTGFVPLIRMSRQLQQCVLKMLVWIILCPTSHFYRSPIIVNNCSLFSNVSPFLNSICTYERTDRFRSREWVKFYCIIYFKETIQGRTHTWLANRQCTHHLEAWHVIMVYSWSLTKPDALKLILNDLGDLIDSSSTSHADITHETQNSFMLSFFFFFFFFFFSLQSTASCSHVCFFIFLYNIRLFSSRAENMMKYKQVSRITCYCNMSVIRCSYFTVISR